MSHSFYNKFCRTEEEQRELFNNDKLDVYKKYVIYSPNIFFELIQNSKELIGSFGEEQFYNIYRRVYFIYSSLVFDDINNYMIDNKGKSILTFAFEVSIDLVRIVADFYDINSHSKINGDTFIMMLIKYQSNPQYIIYFINQLKASLLIKNHHNINGILYLLIYNRFDVIYLFNQEQKTLFMNYVIDNLLKILTLLIDIKNAYAVFYLIKQMGYHKFITVLETFDDFDKVFIEPYADFYGQYRLEINYILSNIERIGFYNIERPTLIDYFDPEINYENLLIEDIKKLRIKEYDIDELLEKIEL